MKYLLIGLLLIGCGKQEHEVDFNIPEKIEIETDIPENINVEVEDSEHKIGFDYPAVYEWCEGNVNHEIEKCNRDDLGQVCIDIETDKEFLIEDCYYDIDTSIFVDINS